MADSDLERPDPETERDAVNDAVRDAITSLKGEEAPETPETPEALDVTAAAAPVEVPESTKEDHPTDPRRFKDGTFKTAKTDAAPQKQAAAPQPKLPTADNVAEASPAPSKAPTPPVSWSADAKQVWATLPPAVQTAALKREEEVSRGFRQYSEQTKAYERVLAPVEQEAQRAGLNVEQGIQRLLDGHRFLEEQPVQAVLWLARKHGLNLAEIAANPPAPQTPVRSEPSIPPQFVQHMSSLEERLNGILMDQNMSALEQFSADPKNAHYADVEDQLPGIMRELAAANPGMKGVQLLSAAYDRAIWLNQDVRDKLIAERTAQTQQTATQKIAEKSARAARAAVSVKGSSADTRPPPKAQQNGAGHVTDDVRAALEQLRAQ
jgi:hypothetical protein